MKGNNEYWAEVSICVHPNRKKLNEYGNYETNHYAWHVIKKYNYPKWIIDKHKRFLDWVLALAQVRFRKHHISFRYYGYKREDGNSILEKKKREIAAAKAQVSRIENAIRDYQDEMSKTLFNDLSNDEIYKKLLCKLDEKKFKLQQALMDDITETVS